MVSCPKMEISWNTVPLEVFLVHRTLSLGIKIAYNLGSHYFHLSHTAIITTITLNLHYLESNQFRYNINLTIHYHTNNLNQLDRLLNKYSHHHHHSMAHNIIITNFNHCNFDLYRIELIIFSEDHPMALVRLK